MSSRTNLLRTYVKEGLVTAEQAKTLPTISQLRRAYLACARELANETIKKARAFRASLSSDKKRQRQALNIKGDMELYAEATMLACCSAQAVENYYDEELRGIIAFRQGKLNLVWRTNRGELNYADRLFKHLPDIARARLAKPRAARPR